MFKRVKNVSRAQAFPDGSSLWFVLENVTNAQVRKRFGTGLASQDKVKYSESIVIQSNATKQYYTLYKCYGVWRVGAGRLTENGVIDQAALEHLFEVTK